MGFWDKIKTTTSEIVESKWSSNESQNPEIDDESAASDKPSSIVKMALSKAASFMLKTTRTVVGKVAKRYHPPLTVDAVVNSDGVRLLFKAYEEEKDNRDPYALMKLASNSLETLDLFRKTYENELKHLDKLERDFKTNTPGTEDALLSALKLDIQRIRSEISTKEKPKLELLEKIRDLLVSPEEVLAATKHDSSLLTCPAIAGYLLMKNPDGANVLSCSQSALYADPLNKDYLNMSMSYEKNELRTRLLSDILKIA